jgi:hypothetical protein
MVVYALRGVAWLAVVIAGLIVVLIVAQWLRGEVGDNRGDLIAMGVVMLVGAALGFFASGRLAALAARR